MSNSFCHCRKKKDLFIFVMRVEFWLFLVAETPLYVNQIAETIIEDQKAFTVVYVSMYV